MNLKAKRLLWTASLSFLILIGIPLLNEVYVLPSKSNTVLIYRYNQETLAVSDFVNFYYAGMVALSDQRLLAYNQQTRLQLSNLLVAPYKVQGPLYCGYLPFVFPLMAPFALLPMVWSYYLWCLLSAAFGVFCLIMLGKQLNFSTRMLTVLCLSTAWSFSSILSLRLGQVSWLLLGVYTLFSWALLKQKDVSGGIMLSLSTIKPQYFPILLAPSLGGKKWRLLFYGVLCELMLFVSAILTIGWQNVADYPKFLQGVESNDNVSSAMICLRACLSSFFSPGVTLTYSLVILAGGFLGLLWLWIRKQSEIEQRWLLAFSIPFILLLSPHTHAHDTLLLALSATLTLPEISKPQPCIWSQVWFALLIAYPVMGYVLFTLPALARTQHWAMIGYLALLVITAGGNYFCLMGSASAGNRGSGSAPLD